MLVNVWDDVADEDLVLVGQAPQAVLSDNFQPAGPDQAPPVCPAVVADVNAAKEKAALVSLLVLTILSQRRADGVSLQGQADFFTWAKVIWAISGFCKRSTEGLQIALQFSARSAKDNPAETRKLYEVVHSVLVYTNTHLVFIP
jgi:hypothetical protein